MVSASLPSSQAGSGSVSVSASLFLSLSQSLFLHLSLSFSLLHLSFVSPEAGEPPELGARPSDTSSLLTRRQPSAGAALPVSGLCLTLGCGVEVKDR